MKPQFLIIGNPENRRVSLFQEAIGEAGLPKARTISYLSILDGTVNPADFISPNTVVRIESPGENFEVEKRILALGGVENAMSLPYEKGQICTPGKWFIGFTQLMKNLETVFSGCLFMNHPSDIVTMFDKLRCKTILPGTIPPLPDFCSFTDFISYVKEQSRRRFFIKLRSSSSASGVCAFEYNPASDAVQMYSTVEFVPAKTGYKFYNSLKIKKYRDIESIIAVTDFLFSEGAFAEPWIPKSKHDGESYDLRVLAIDGEACHSAVRLSRSPMTNLHLGNRRCSIEEIALSSVQKEGIIELVKSTAEHFPRSIYTGLDILFPRGSEKPILLEANAFGDLINNIKHRGKSAYSAEIAAVTKRYG